MMNRQLFLLIFVADALDRLFDLKQQFAFNAHNQCMYMITWLSILKTICYDGNSPTLKIL